MKTYRRILALLMLWTLLLFVAVCAKAAETNNWWQETWNAVNPLLTASNYTYEVYGTYAENAPDGQKWGGGLIAAYNLSDYVAPGIGVDYLGQFTMVSGNVTLRLPVKPFASLAPQGTFLHDVTAIPVVYGALGTPLSGSSTAPATIAGYGAFVQFGHLWGGQFNAGFTRSHWDNAGIYSGARDHAVIGWSRGF